MHQTTKSDSVSIKANVIPENVWLTYKYLQNPCFFFVWKIFPNWGKLISFFHGICRFGVMEVKDSNGNVLQDGDNVTLIKDLKVKGSSLTLKRGTVVKKIKLTDDPDEVDCRINGSGIVLRTEFLKKV